MTRARIDNIIGIVSIILSVILLCFGISVEIFSNSESLLIAGNCSISVGFLLMINGIIYKIITK